MLIRYLIRTSFRIVLILLAASFGSISHAQNTITDSLNRVLLMIMDDSTKAEVYMDLAKAYYFGENSLRASEEALKYAQSHGNNQLISRALIERGWSYYGSDLIDSAVIYADKSLEILKPDFDHQGLSESYAFRALLFMEYGQYHEAKNMYHKAAEAAAEAGIKKAQAKIANNLGVLYYRMEDYESSLEQLFQCLKWSESIGDDIYIGRAYYNIGRDYFKMNKYEKAYNWLIKSIQKRKEIHYYNGVAEGMYTMAEMIFSLPESDLKQSLLSSLKNEGYSNAFDLLRMAETLPTLDKNKSIKHHIEQIRIKGLESINEYKEAYTRLKKYKQVNDSILLNGTNLEAIANLKIKYEKELLEAENELKEAELKQRKNIQYFLSSLAVMLLGILIFSLQYFRQNRTLNELQHQRELDEKVNLVNRLNDRISDLLEETQQLDLRPLSELNEIIENQLSEKEYEVLNAIARGLTNKEIATEQFISENTVKFHLKNIYSKLDVANRREAVKKVGAMV